MVRLYFKPCWFCIRFVSSSRSRCRSREPLRIELLLSSPLRQHDSAQHNLVSRGEVSCFEYLKKPKILFINTVTTEEAGTF